MPANYHLTFSRSETNEDDCRRVLRAGGNVAAVFADRPSEYTVCASESLRFTAPVIDGDANDLRHLAQKGVIVGLAPKGARARRDTSGFVIR